MHLPSGAESSILDHLNAMKVRVSSSSLAESHSICSAAGAIYALKNFTQSDGTLTIENSAAKFGGAVHLGAPSGEFRDVARAGFEAVVGSFKLWFPGYVNPV